MRVGLPTVIAMEGLHQLLLGYEGSMHLVESMANALLEGRERIGMREDQKLEQFRNVL